MKYSGRHCRLSPEQLAQLKARYYLYQSNSPDRIAEDLGISVSTFYNYLRGKHKIGTERRTAQGLGTAPHSGVGQ